MMQKQKIQYLFKDYFGLYSPSLSKGIGLLEMLLEQGAKSGELDLLFNLICREIEPYLQENSSTEEKAEIFRLVLFDKFRFEVKNLTEEKQLSLKQVIRTRKTTPMFMGVLYLLLAKNFNTPAFLALNSGRIFVCFAKEYNFPAVYIEMQNNGCFMTESELYLSSGGPCNLQVLDTKQIIKHLLSNLIYLYTKQNAVAKKKTIQSILSNY